MRLDHLLSKERLAGPGRVSRGGCSWVERWLFGAGWSVCVSEYCLLLVFAGGVERVCGGWLCGWARCWVVRAWLLLRVVCLRLLVENCTVDASICGQVFKGARWMPWYQEPMKDVGGRDSPRGVVNRAVIRGFPNGGTRQSLWAVTCR